MVRKDVHVPDDTTTGRHFGVENESSTGLFELSINGRQECIQFGREKGGGLMSAHVYLSSWFVLELLQKGALLNLSSQAIREAFANWLRVCAMELAVDG